MLIMYLREGGRAFLGLARLNVPLLSAKTVSSLLVFHLTSYLVLGFPPCN